MIAGLFLEPINLHGAPGPGPFQITATAGSGDFGSVITLPGGSNPATVIVADVNGDGRPDLVVSNILGDNVSVFIGVGDGNFAPKTDYATGGAPLGVAVADVDGNGSPDIVVANYHSDTVSVLLNTGNGTFAAKTDYPAGSVVESVAIGDVNGDGKPDLAVSNWGTSAVSVLLGNGLGSFAAATAIPVGGQAQWVAIADVSGDGIPDLVVANDNNVVSVLLGTGGGSFGPRTDYPVGSQPIGGVVGDVNGDGALDVLVTNSGDGTVSLLLNTGNGHFGLKTDYAIGDGAGDYPASVALADLDGDGTTDVAAMNLFGSLGHKLSLFFGAGDGTFAGKTDYPAGSEPSDVKLADVNADGVSDVVVAMYKDNTVAIQLGLGGAITSPGVTTVTAGGSKTYTITPQSGYVITNVLVDGVSQGPISSYSFTNVSASHTIRAAFRPVPPHLVLEQPAGSPLVSGGTVGFGSVPTGAAASLTFQVKNTGAADLTGLGITIDGADAAAFSVTAPPTAPVTGPTGTTTFTVRFTAGANGPRTATLHLKSNDPTANPFNITLTGSSGASPAPLLVVEQPVGTAIASGVTADFGDVQVGGHTSLTFTIRNNGTADLVGLGLTIDGPDQAVYSVTTSPVAPVNPGGTTTLTVQFTPVATGPRTAAIHVTSNDSSNNPFNINFTASGLGDASPTLSFTQPTAGSVVTGSVTLTATANQASADDASGVAGVQFKVDGVNLGAEMTSAPYTAAWDTTTASNGNHTLSAVARDAAGNKTTVAVVVSVANATLLTTQVPGSSNAGNYELGVRVVPDVAGQIVGVRFWKVAGDSGTHTGHVWSAAGQLLASVVFATETASGWQQQSLSPPLSTLANTPYVISVNANGTWMGTNGFFNTALVNGHLTGPAGNNGIYGPAGTFPTAAYSGFNYFRDLVFVPVVAAPTRILALGGNLAFGNVAVNTTATRTMTIGNTGNSPLTVSSISYPAGFSGDWASGTIAAGASQNVMVTFAPTALTSYGGTITVIADQSSGTNTIDASGTGASPTRLIALGGDLAFGNVPVNTTATSVLTIGNSGTAPLTVSGFSYPAGFSGNWAGGSIVAGGSQNVTVTFAPTAVTSYGGTITVAGDQTSGTNTIAASGTGSASLPPQTLLTTQQPGGTTSGSYELGVRIVPDVSGQITGVRFWKPSGESGTHTGRVWSAGGQLLASVVFANETASGWQQQSFSAPVSTLANTPYIVSVNATTVFMGTAGFFNTSLVNGHLTGPANNNGIYGPPGSFPTATYSNFNYFRDVVFVPDQIAPTRILGLGGNLAFGNVAVNTTATRTMTISNTGNSTLTVSNLSYPAGFSGDWANGTIVAGGSQNVTVTFAPTALTSYGGTITVTADQTSGTNTIAASGTGAAVSRIISLAGNLAFGNVTVNTTATSVMTIGNSGSAPLTVSGISYPPGFNGNWAGGSIAAGGSQNVTVTFAPTALTSYGGTITVTADQTSGTNTIEASGTGASATRLIALGGDLAFGNVPVNTTATSVLTISNGGSAPLTVSGISYPTAFSGNWAGGSIAAGGSQNVTVTFAPTAVTSYGGTITVTGDQTSGTNTIAASGTGSAAPTSQTLLTTQVPGGANSGAYELGVRIVPDVSGQITAVRFWKAAGDSGTHTGHVWSAGGQLLATAVFANETASGWQQQSLSSPLSTLANTSYIISVNANSTWLATGSFFATPLVNGHLTGPSSNNGLYGPAGAFPTATYSNFNYFRDMVFAPDTGQPTQIIAVGGNLAFGNVAVNTTATRTMTISNTGNTPLTVSSLSYPAGFSGDWTNGTIGAGGSQNVTVTFAPTALTSYGGTITVTADQTSGANTIAASGTGAATSRVIALNGNLAFGNVMVNTTTTTVLTIANTGTATLTVSNISYPSGFSGNWAGGAIAAGGSQNVTVTFAPTAVTSYGGTVTVTADQTSGTNTIAASGTGSASQPSQTLLTTQVPAAAVGGTYELGVRIVPDVTGQITRIRYWKASADSGTHTGHVWSATGQLLASVVFANETASGWQEQALASPLSTLANTSYIVSVNATGTWMGTTGFFNTPLVNAHLQAPSNNNGLYGTAGTFPATTYSNFNYFRDIVFVPD